MRSPLLDKADIVWHATITIAEVKFRLPRVRKRCAERNVIALWTRAHKAGDSACVNDSKAQDKA